MHHIISYDISDDFRRNKVHKLLIRKGAIRLQYSVYLLMFDFVELRVLIHKLKLFLDKPEVESIYIFKADQKLLNYNIDNNRLKYYLSKEIEEIYL